MQNCPRENASATSSFFLLVEMLVATRSVFRVVLRAIALGAGFGNR
jgi:hypothetical protein